MNNYDYFTEIENAFVRRRGRNLLLGPVDWQLMERWEKEGIPLRIVLATIDDVFDKIEDDPKRTGSIRTLSYCKDAVEARYRSWLESQVGGNEGGEEEEIPVGPSGTELVSLAKKLESAAAEFGDEIARVLKDASAELRTLAEGKHGAAESEAELERLDEVIDSALLEYTDGGKLAEAKLLVEKAIGSRRATMGEDAYERTEELMIRKQLREGSGIPRLGMFYL